MLTREVLTQLLRFDPHGRVSAPASPSLASAAKAAAFSAARKLSLLTRDQSQQGAALRRRRFHHHPDPVWGGKQLDFHLLSLLPWQPQNPQRQTQKEIYQDL